MKPWDHDIVFTWNANTRVTQGVLRVVADEERNLIVDLIHSLRSIASHPLMLAIATLEATHNRWKEMLSDEWANIQIIQARTGHYGAMVEFDGEVALKPQDYADLGKDLTSSSQDLASRAMRLKSTERLHTFLLEAISQLEQDGVLRSTEQDGVLRSIEQEHGLIRSILRRYSSALGHLLDRLHFLQELCRLQNQTVSIQHNHCTRFAIRATDGGQVYNLISQCDMQLNLEVARDSKSIAAASKRDSSA